MHWREYSAVSGSQTEPILSEDQDSDRSKMLTTTNRTERAIICPFQGSTSVLGSDCSQRPDMREHGWEQDAWPEILEKVMAADILLIGSSIWLGEKSSVCTQTIERLYSASHLLNDAGQYAYYGRVGGCLITGNEDGVKHGSMNILYSRQHLGYTIPPQADAGWIGEAGPGPSYMDEGSGGPENDFTNRNVTFMTWNLLHLARMLKDAGGIPAHGNQRSEWDAGCRFDFPNPEHR